MTPEPSIKKICEVCKKEFNCSAESGICWCFDINLPDSTLAELNAEFKNCLCENCLKAARKMSENTN